MTLPFRGSGSEISRHVLNGPGYERVTRDVFVLRDQVVDLRSSVEAHRLVFPDGAACHTTAGLLLKLPVDGDRVVHLARGKLATRFERSGLTIHRLPLREDEIYDLNGIPVTTGPRTYVDLAASCDLEDLVALGDVVVRRWGRNDVDKAVRGWGRRRGAVLLRAAAPLLDPGSDSPAETRARLRLHAAGFTALRHKVVVKDLGGGWLGVPDLADEEARVALQHEGAVHFDQGVRQWRKDVDRDEVVRAEGWQLVSVTAIDDADPDRLLRKVTAAYRRSAALWGRAVLPPHLR